MWGRLAIELSIVLVSDKKCDLRVQMYERCKDVEHSLDLIRRNLSLTLLTYIRMLRISILCILTAIKFKSDETAHVHAYVHINSYHQRTCT